MKTFFLLLISLCFTVLLQAQVSKTADVTAGSLKTVLTTNELSSVTNLTLTGTIDARDFKTMRDDMPVLSVLDLSGVTVKNYSGTEGTGGTTYSTSYPANTVPFLAFFNESTEQGKKSLTSVLLPLTITSIDIGAFYKCSGLTSVSIPSSVTSFGIYAFAECSKLTAITISSVVSTIGNGTFLGCSGLITVDENNPDFSSLDGVLYNKTLTNLINCPTSKNGSFVIPASVISIEDGAFYACSGLTSVSIPASVTSIGYIAFFGCSGLTSISTDSSYPIDMLPDNEIFSGVNKTTCTLNVPYGAKRFYATALQWKDFLSIVEEPTGFILSSNFIKIASEAGSQSSVNLSANVAWKVSSDQTWLTANPTSGTGNETVSFTAEANSSVLSRSAKITFSATGFASQILSVNQEGMNKTVQVTAGGLFAALTGEELSGISNLTLTGIMDARDFKMLRDAMPNLSVLNLSGIRIAAYNGTEGPSDYFSAYQANAIPAYAFFNSNTQKGKGSLTTINLPLSITLIDSKAFSDCNGLTSVVIPTMVTTIGYEAFQGCTSLTSVTIPSSVTQIENNALSSGAWISVEASNPNYSSLDGVLFNKDKTTLIQCPTSKTGNYNIPSSVIYIEYGAFVACNSLTNITIPSSVTSVEGSAFNNCTGLISVDANNQNYSGIDGVLFNKNTTTLIKCPISKSGSYVIPSKVTNIDVLAFYYCSLLNSITIPVSVTSIADGAFNYCTGLTSLYANSSYPIKLEQYTYIFEHVNRTTCTLNVPFGAKKLYAAAEQWKDFTNIIEAAKGFILSSVFLKLDAADGSSDTINITSNVSWTANSNQTWLTVNPTSGSGNNTFTFIAAKNNLLAARRAFVTVSATGFGTQTITINQSGSPEKINIEAGGLHSVIPPNELNQISNLIINGTMDARDFKFLRDNMPSLAELDLSGVTISAYSGTEGTSYMTDYPANTVPQYAFYNLYNYSHNSNLTTIILPSTITSIGNDAFHYCEGLTSVTIPPSVTSIGSSAFMFCRSLTSIHAKSSYPVDLNSAYSVFYEVDKNICKLNVPYGSKELYSVAARWQDFKNIVEESQGFLISPIFLKLTADSGSSATANIVANVAWTATSDQTWLIVNPTSGTGGKTLSFTADANTSVITRTAKVTFSATGVTSQSITISQDGQPEIIDVTAGALASKLTPDKLNGITNLIITGTIDARDFKTLRDNMPSLAVLDISGATVVAYSGTDGTSYQTEYPANAVPESAFYSPNTGNGKTSLTSVVLPATLTKIGTIAFQDCSGLNSIIIPSSVSEFGSNAFSGCSSLTSVDLPSSLYIVQVGAFYNCKSLTTITIPSSVVLIGNEAFSGCTGLTTVNLPSSLVYIWDYAFRGCSSLTAINLPSSVKTIGESVFSECLGLTSIVIPSLVTSIAKNTFQFCINLTSVTIPSSVTSIGEGAFAYCRSLTSVTIPASVTLIGSSAFTQCTGLASIFANSSHPVNLTSSPGVFSGINKTTCTLNVPYKAKELYASANQWKDFIKINDATQGFRWDPPIVSFSVEGGNATLNSTANVVWTTSFDQTWLTVNPTSGTGIQTITFTAEENSTVIRRILKVTVSAPDVLSQIITVIQEGRPDTINIEPGGLLSSRTVAERNGITNLTLTGIMDARDFKTIRDEMPLLEVLDLSGVTIAAYSGTEGTSYQMEYPANTIPENAFYYTNTGKGKTSLSSVVFPLSVISIGNFAFNNCTGLTTLSIPASVNSIGYGALGYCSGLTSIFANSGVPVDLSSSWSVFDGIDKNSCTLNVPYGSRNKYASAYYWQDFINIIEPDSGFRIDPIILTISATAGSTATATITSNVSWTASCDQPWLTVNPASGNGDQTLSFTAEVNSQNTSRKAIVTISAQGIPSQIVYVTQEPAPLEVTAGNLKTLLSAEDLATRTKLTLIGTIDARDFKTMRDDMPNLKEIDLSGVSIVSYSGNGGTAWYITEYPANKFPDLAFYSLYSYSGKQSLISVTIPNTVINIGSYAFQGCNNLPDINIPESVTVIEDGAFMLCSSLTTVNIPSSINFIGSWAFQFCNNLTLIEVDSNYPVNLTNSENVFNGVNVYSCLLNVPYGSASRYATANQWKDFTNIVEATNGFNVSSVLVNIDAAAGSTASEIITSNVVWTASSDQNWLTIDPTSGTGTQTLTFTAEANNAVIQRSAKVTVSASGFDSQIITVTQAASPLNVTAGNLKTFFTAEELSTITKLTLTGTIDARDFKTMRDDMPNLAEIDLSGVTITAYTGTDGTAPATISIAYPANEIPVFAFYNDYTGARKITLTSFIFPSKVTSIGYNSFLGAFNLTSIIIPSSITHIGIAAFSSCSKLSLVNIPASVISIGDVAFQGCGNINVEIDNPNYSSIDGILFNKTQTTLIQYPSSKTGNFIIPSSVISIGFAAFTNSSLTSITIPSSLISMGNWAFQQCISLTSIYVNSSIPVNLNASDGVFSGINKTMCTLYVPYKAKALYSAASQWKDFTTIVEATNGFNVSSVLVNIAAAAGSIATADLTANIAWTVSSNQTWLTVNPTSGTGNQTLTFTAEANNAVIQRSAKVTVSASGFDSQIITVTQAASPLNVTAGNLKTFFTAEELSSITKLKLTGTIDARDFKTMRDDMPNLTELDLSEVTIEAYTGIEGTAPGTTNIVYPANAIPQSAFNNPITSIGKISLNSVILPSSLKAIGDWAFSNCNGFTSILIPPLVTSIGYCSFYSSRGLTSITIPASVSSIGGSAFQGSTGMIIVDENNLYYSSVDGILFNKQKTTLVQCTTSNTGTYAIPSSVTTIGNEAFTFCYNLTSVILPSSVTSIGRGAFANCNSLTSINIPPAITYIGNSAFWYCINLDSITVERSLPLNLSSSTDVFTGIDKTTCTLYVPYGSKLLYAAANQWKDFTNIVEMPGVLLSTKTASVKSKQGSTATINITSNVTWTASSDQTWLQVNPASGTGAQTLTFTADANPVNALRTATVIVTAEGIESQTITITQEGWPTSLNDIVENSVQFECYPNPFADKITIEIQNPTRTKINVDIYNLAGERIKNLASGISEELIDIIWNGTNDSGQKVAPGVYICKMNNQLKKMIYKGK